MLWAFPSIIVPFFLILNVTSIAVLLGGWSTSLQMMYWQVDERISLSQILISCFSQLILLWLCPAKQKTMVGRVKKAC